MKTLRWALPGAILSLLVLAAPGFALTRYASPGGSTGNFGHDGTQCTEAAPCSFYTAVGFAQAGDTVLLKGGNYTVDLTVNPPSNTLITSAPGEYANVTFDSTHFLSITVADVTLRNFSLNGSYPPYFVNFGTASSNGLMDRMSIRYTGTGLALIMPPTTTLRDSLVVRAGATTTANAVEADGTILNSTIVAEGAGVTNNTAVFRSCGYHTGGTGTYSLVIRNSILRAVGGSSVNAGLTVPAPGTCTFNTDVDYSNFGSSSANVTTLGTHNVSAPPTLNSSYQQVAGSSSIDRGTAASVFPGELALFGSPRLSGAAPDIGADEYYVAPRPPANSGGTDTTKPVISDLKARKKRGKLKTFDFTSTEPGTATFAFTRKKGKKYKSAGSQRKDAKAGKNTIKPKKLKKGSYRLSLTVKDAAGNTSIAKKLSFKVK